MNMPILHGTIDRRMLVNFRVPGAVLRKFLPPPFRPKLVHGVGLAGICLIRLKDVCPRGLPAFAAITSENMAHRIAVEWEDERGEHQGVYILRRDTSSALASYIGGKLFPGVHHYAKFNVREEKDRFAIAVTDADQQPLVNVTAATASSLPQNSVFDSLNEASNFFRTGSLGWSPNDKPGTFDCLELHTTGWQIEPLTVEHVESAFFRHQPFVGATEFDSAFLMRNIEHEWHAHSPITYRPPTEHRILSAFYEMP